MNSLSKVTKNSIQIGIYLLTGLMFARLPAFGQEFPMESCGDENDVNATTLYPVILYRVSLEQVRSSLCKDAFEIWADMRGVQVASFRSFERAAVFSWFLDDVFGDSSRTQIGDGYKIGQTELSFLSTEQEITEPKIIWQLQAEEGLSVRFTEIDNELIYAVSSNGSLHALDLATGQEQWACSSCRSDSGRNRFPVIIDNLLYIGRDAINTSTGQLQWRFNRRDWWLDLFAIRYGAREFRTSYPVVVNSIIYFTGGYFDELLYAADATTGQRLWTFNPKNWYSLGTMYMSAPTVSDSVVYTMAGINSHVVLYAIDAETGEELWKARGGNRADTNSDVSPVVIYGSAYVQRGYNIFSIDANTGQENWQFEVSHRINEINFSAVTENMMYLSGDINLYAVDTETGQEQWRYSTGGMISSSPVVANDVVYVGSEDRNLYAVDATTGWGRWRFRTGGAITSLPVVTDGVVYIQSRDNYLYAIDLSTGQGLWKFRIGNPVSSPVVSNGTVYVASEDGNLYAIEQ